MPHRAPRQPSGPGPALPGPVPGSRPCPTRSARYRNDDGGHGGNGGHGLGCGGGRHRAVARNMEFVGGIVFLVNVGGVRESMEKFGWKCMTVAVCLDAATWFLHVFESKT